jgi:uncharacterized protein (TIRG00374 family)
MAEAPELSLRRTADSAHRQWVFPTARAARMTVWTLIGAAAIAVGGWAVWGQIPSPSSIGGSLADANPGWLLVAVVAEIVSILAFSMVQRRLVMDLGGRLSRRRSVELTLASGAIASTLPGGSAIGAGYTYRRLRRAGLEKADIGVTMLASSGLLTGALLLLYVALTGPSLLDGLAGLIGHRHLRMLVLLGLVLVLLAVFRHRRTAGETIVLLPQRGLNGPPPTSIFGRAARSIVQFARSSRASARTIPVSSWQTGAVWAVTKWAADFAVLACATFAVGVSVDFVSLATVYVGIQALRQIPFTPGGIGVIEAALLTGLITAGAVAAPAAAAVVIYRVLTLWLILPAGAVAAVLDRAPAVAPDRALAAA